MNKLIAGTYLKEVLGVTLGLTVIPWSLWELERACVIAKLFVETPVDGRLCPYLPGSQRGHLLGTTMASHARSFFPEVEQCK